MNRTAPAFDILRDPGIAARATGARPLWLFDPAGTKLVFANPSGAALFGFASCTAAVGASFENTEVAAQVSRSAATLRQDGHPRLERLRGMGTPFGRPLTCACSRIMTATGSAILVAAMEACGPALLLAECARRLIEGSGAAVAAFGADGQLLHATPEATTRLDGTVSLANAKGNAEMLHLGEGADAITLALLPEPAGQVESPPVDLSPIADAMAEMSRTQQPAPIAVTEPLLQDQSAATDETSRRHPMRFVWETDAENRFTIANDDFIAIAGPRTASLLGRFWGEISAKLALDPEGLVAHAMVSRDTWSGIDVHWPTANGERIRIELSGIPAFDRERVFSGYRGWGVWRDQPLDDTANADPVAPVADAQAAPAPAEPEDERLADIPEADTPVTLPVEANADVADVTDADIVGPPENVVPFRAASAAGSEPKPAIISPTERAAFRELTSRLATRLKSADELARGQAEHIALDNAPDYAPPLPAAPLVSTQTARDLRPSEDHLAVPRPILDQLPFGVLIYRLNSFLYANAAFLELTSHASLGDFAQAGGLDSLFIEPDSHAPDDADGGQRLRIAMPGNAPLDGRLVTVPFDGESAMALVLYPAAAQRPVSQDTEARSDELAALLDVAADGFVVTDRDGRILEANAGAARLFGYERTELAGRPFGSLFAPESERAGQTRLDRLAATGDTDPIDDTREIIGRRRQGGLISLHLILGRADRSGSRFCAAFRDITKWKDAEKELVAARRQAEKASSAKSEFLAKISHEMRTPLNAIIGFSEVMMEQRFGPVGNERYRDYLKDINTSGAHLVSLLNDLLDLSKIEAGKLELSFERVNLNDLTQQSVAIMQAQANRARIIIRTALSMNVPGIVADARSVRQIILNLLSNSIKFTGAGGQVIVSTAATDRGDVILRVRDTGIGMSEKDIETALQPFRQLATSSRTDANGTGLGLPLTKALAEANRARFSIKSAVNAGTLVEIAFPAPRVLAE